MKISKRGLLFIEEFEGFRSKPYLDTGGVWTIGIGTIVYPNGTKVSGTDRPISRDRALELLEIDLIAREKKVKSLLKVDLNQNQYDAIISFAYNVGTHALSTSTLLKRLNVNPCDPDIAYQFSRWNKDNGKVIAGLVRRREAESKMYFS